MKTIAKIVIKSSSGYCMPDAAYTDRIVLEPDSIRYEYSPLYPSESNPPRKWSYKTTTADFRKLFDDIASATVAILNRTDVGYALDVGNVSFTVTYDDKSKDQREFALLVNDFSTCFKLIRRMVPKCERQPAVLE